MFDAHGALYLIYEAAPSPKWFETNDNEHVSQRSKPPS